MSCEVMCFLFIQELSTNLVAAFRATLEQVS